MSAVTEEEERQTAELESEQEVGVGGTTSQVHEGWQLGESCEHHHYVSQDLALGREGLDISQIDNKVDSSPKCRERLLDGLAVELEENCVHIEEGA